MKSFTTIFQFILPVLFLHVTLSNSFAQTEDDLDCYFSADTANQNTLESIPVLQDTSLRIAILFVQFADWETNINARGSVGFDQADSQFADTVFNKYRYHHLWEMYFSKNTYIDEDPELPSIHPDAGSHDIAVYGSFRDYWWEVSHKNLAIKPAVTHPDSTQLDTTSIFYTGIINNYNPADSTIIWITLDQPISYYCVSPTDTNLTGFYM